MAVAAAVRCRRKLASREGTLMAKNFITGAAQQVSASPQRVTDIMKHQPDISAGKPKGAPEGKGRVSSRASSEAIGRGDP
jgi:hypothetical protein